MRRYAPSIIVGLVAAAVVGSGTFLYRAKRAANPQLKISKETGEQGAESAHVLGPADATVTLEEFGDFQCPPCGKLSEPINQLQKQYNLRIIYRNFPLPVHEHAKEAAYAAEAAGRQGRFWQMHDLLFREQAVWSKSTDARALFNAYAGMLQLDLGRFKQDMDSTEVQQQVDFDKQRGTLVGVSTTPTIFLNNQAVPPAQLGTSDSLAAAVEAAVKSAKPSS
jgi:protein-disulfide isomerase